MPRRTAAVPITRDGRDKGGVFEIEEMSAFAGCEWFLRAGQILARSGTDVPADIGEHGATGFVALGMGAIISGLGKAPWTEVKPLLDELLGCVKSYTPPGGQVPIQVWGAIVSQVQEPTTFLQLYEEVLSLLVGFSVAASLSTFARRVVAAVGTALGQTTETSQEKSDLPLPADMPA
ncbi:MAG TPA: hypothetical protein VNF49_01745 [Candidatus Binataceae bacterium]|nr:hypothetical protein [Candidatus Binataceae bacterium]